MDCAPNNFLISWKVLLKRKVSIEPCWWALQTSFKNIYKSYWPQTLNCSVRVTHQGFILKLSVLCLMSMFFPLSGVLLLNSVLTVRAHQPTSHEGQGWEIFTDAVVLWLSRNLNGLVFSALGLLCSEEGQSDRQSKFMETELWNVNIFIRNNCALSFLNKVTHKVINRTFLKLIKKYRLNEILKQFYFYMELLSCEVFAHQNCLLLLDTFASGMNNQGYCECCI